MKKFGTLALLSVTSTALQIDSELHSEIQSLIEAEQLAEVNMDPCPFPKTE